MRHININTLWVQCVQDKEGFEFNTIFGNNNPADLVTTFLSRDVIDRPLTTLGQEIREGRADKGLEMQGSSAANHDEVTVRVARVSLHRPATYEGGGEAQALLKKSRGTKARR